MEDIIAKLVAKSSSIEFSTSSGRPENKGLAKITCISFLSRPEMLFLYSMFLDDRKALVFYKAHLLQRIDRDLVPEIEYQHKIVHGALRAYLSNAYRIVVCYKCKGLGCIRCGNSGKTHKNPKSYELCGIKRSTWNNKQFLRVRKEYASLYEYITVMESDIRKKIREEMMLDE